jgi:acetyl/propionyl-CoA carboxylase alpha subunit
MERLIQEAHAVGFPLLLKASAGGGGKGMRIVYEDATLAQEIQIAKSEALRLFGNERLLMEKYIENGRHIEVQIIGDTHGNMFHLFERECTIQRRNQKIIEEAPSHVVTEKLRATMGQSAVELGQSLRYCGVGTVEFIMDADMHAYYFLEVNTRLQVEHPVTELVTKLDLVELQIFVANGCNLMDSPVPHVRLEGHAIECRLYAEDPANEFYPQTGRVLCWKPSTAEYMRFDSGIATGSTVSVYYDPMVVKAITFAPTRSQAIAQMRQGLAQTALLGVVHNIPLLSAILRHDAFCSAAFTTKFVYNAMQQNMLGMVHERAEVDAVLAAHVFHVHQRTKQRMLWKHIPSGWTNMPRTPAKDAYTVTCLGSTQEHQLQVEYVGADMTIQGTTVNGRVVSVEQQDHVHTLCALVGGVRRTFTIAQEHETDLWIHSAEPQPYTACVRARSRLYSASNATKDDESRYLTPMPAKILKLTKSQDGTVKAGETLITLESMKMETRLYAKRDGVVHYHVTEGQLVDAGKLLCEVK